MPKINPRIKSIDDLLGLDAAEESPIEPTPSVSLPTKNTIITLPPQAIRAFRGHPFRLYEGDRLNDLVESISEHGVLNPAIIRKIERDEDGFEYEMLAGHNRQNAAAIANRELPCIVKENLSDEDYLKENPDKTEHDFAELKALSDQIYYEQDRAESAQTRKDVSIHGLEETEHCATRALDEEWEERVVDIQNRKYAWKALEQLFTVGALTEVQKRRFRLHVFQGLSTRQIGRMEGTSHQAVAKSINLAIAKLKKYFAAQG